MSVVIKIENLSKQYRLGLVSTRTLSHDINRWVQMNVLGKEDPYLKVGEVNNTSAKASSDYVWALRDINLEVQEGEVLGIIGKNGAGKSTLLKILSKVTAPTTGSIKAKGRIASLLEVGTGFHPEMTGSENIFMNGALLGMTKVEILKKYDDIVDFSGVEKYIDTPIKRYSTGMMVRLGFAVAAFLDPEILLVDEVLAVGDADFQKKALGKIEHITKGDGRTVLFVSHNMRSVYHLCTKGIYLHNGKVFSEGEISKIIDNYLFAKNENDNGARNKIPENNNKGYFTSWKISNKRHLDFSIYSDQSFEIVFTYNSKIIIYYCEIGLVIRNNEGNIIFGVNSRDNGGDFFSIYKGIYHFKFKLLLPIIQGDYELDIVLVSNNEIIDQWISSTRLNVRNNFESVLSEKWRGIVNVKSLFSFEKFD